MLGAGANTGMAAGKGVSKRVYWISCAPTGWRPESPTGAWCERALLDTVDRHFVSDVPVGVFLSGGIDSTALVALARGNSATAI